MGETTEAQAAPGKKSVALSGVVAGNTGICTVGRAGNDLHYRGYDVTALAKHASFEEVAYLLLYERLPTLTQLIQYRKKLKTLRGLPVALKPVLENLPASAHPMDVLHVGNATLGTILPRPKTRTYRGAGYRGSADFDLSFDPAVLVPLVAQRQADRNRDRRRYDRRALPPLAPRQAALRVVCAEHGPLAHSLCRA